MRLRLIHTYERTSEQIDCSRIFFLFCVLCVRALLRAPRPPRPAPSRTISQQNACRLAFNKKTFDKKKTRRRSRKTKLNYERRKKNRGRPKQTLANKKKCDGRGRSRIFFPTFSEAAAFSLPHFLSSPSSLLLTW